MPEEQNEDPTLRQLVDALCLEKLGWQTAAELHLYSEARELIARRGRRLQLEAALAELNAEEQPKKDELNT